MLLIERSTTGVVVPSEPSQKPLSQTQEITGVAGVADSESPMVSAFRGMAEGRLSAR